MPQLPPMGEHAERRLRKEMADWDDDRLIAKTVKQPGLAEDIAARQILEARRSTKETRRFIITTIIGVVGVLLSAAAAWFAWKAIPQEQPNVHATQQLPALASSGAHKSSSSSMQQTQSMPRSAIEQQGKRPVVIELHLITPLKIAKHNLTSGCNGIDPL